MGNESDKVYFKNVTLNINNNLMEMIDTDSVATSELCFKIITAYLNDLKMKKIANLTGYSMDAQIRDSIMERRTKRDNL